MSQYDIEKYKDRKYKRLMERAKKSSNFDEVDSVDRYRSRRRARILERSDADEIWKTTKGGKHYAMNAEGDITKGPKQIVGKNIKEVKKTAEKRAERSSGKTASRNAEMVNRILKKYGAKDPVKWNNDPSLSDGTKFPKLKDGAVWNASTIERLEDEANRAGLGDNFRKTVKNLKPSDIVYQTEPDGTISACVPGLATMFDKTLVGRSERAQEAYNAKRIDGEQITKDMLGIAASVGSSLDSVENNFKGGKSASGKIDRTREKYHLSDDVTDEDIVRDYMGDITRFTMVSSYDNMVKDTNRMCKVLEKQGYEIMEVDNKWTDPSSPTYKGIHVKAKSPSGQNFEVQIHSREDQSLKALNHEDYEISRDKNRTQEERDAANKRMIERYSSLPMPEGIEDLKSFKKQ